MGITFGGQPVGSKEFRRGRNTFTFTGLISILSNHDTDWFLDENGHVWKFSCLLSAGVEHQRAEVVCAAVNTFGSANSSLLLAVQTENPKELTENRLALLALVLHGTGHK